MLTAVTGQDFSNERLIQTFSNYTHHAHPLSLPLLTKDLPSHLKYQPDRREVSQTSHSGWRRTPEQYAGADGSAVNITTRTRSSKSAKLNTLSRSPWRLLLSVFLLVNKPVQAGTKVDIDESPTILDGLWESLVRKLRGWQWCLCSLVSRNLGETSEARNVDLGRKVSDVTSKSGASGPVRSRPAVSEKWKVPYNVKCHISLIRLCCYLLEQAPHVFWPFQLQSLS